MAQNQLRKFTYNNGTNLLYISYVMVDWNKWLMENLVVEPSIPWNTIVALALLCVAIYVALKDNDKL